jgi:hypothetical protein
VAPILSSNIERNARLSSDSQYRYALTRTWDRRRDRVLFVGLNPSTADHEIDDPTVRRCIGFAISWGFGSVDLVNLFAYRATDPAELCEQSDPIGPENDRWISHYVNTAKLVIVAWGHKGSLHNRDSSVLSKIIRPHCLGVTRDGFPRHPLYVPGITRPAKYRIV